MTPLLLLLLACLKPGFSVHGEVQAPATPPCPGFEEEVATRAGWLTVVGAARPSPTEDQARARALADARRQARAHALAPYADAVLARSGDDASFTVGPEIDPMEQWLADLVEEGWCVVPVEGAPPRVVAWVRAALPLPESAP